MFETMTGTKELTGLEMTRTKTLERSQHSAIESPSWLMIPAFTLNKSSRVMPGFLGTTAGIQSIEAVIQTVLNAACGGVAGHGDRSIYMRQVSGDTVDCLLVDIV